MKVSIMLVLMLASGGTSVTAAFAPTSSTFSLQFLGVAGGAQLSILHEATGSAGSSSSGPEISTVSTQPETHARNEYVSNSISWKAVSSSEAQMASSVVCGCLLTFFLNNFLFVGPIIASSFVGMIATMILPEKLALAAFCGSFAGMARKVVIPNMYASSVLGCVCATLMVLFDRKKWIVGVGGRLGFIAQLGCTSLFFISSLFSPPQPAARLVGAYPPTRILLSQLLPTCIFTAVGALLMSAWKEALTSHSRKVGGLETARGRIFNRLSTSVGAASATGLIMSLFPGSAGGPGFCGSFIAMSSPGKIETYGGLMGASLIGGMSQILLAGIFLGGWGGKLGTASLLGVLLYRQIITLFASK